MVTTVVVLVGLPGSGKSTIARQLCETRQSSVHIEYDAVAASLSEVDDLAAWRRSRTVALEGLIKYLKESARLVVLDDNFHLRSMRKAIYQICRNHAAIGIVIYFGVVFIETPVDLCLDRNAKRGGRNRVADDTITKMSAKLEPPDTSKSEWDSNSMRFKGDKVDLCVIFDWLCQLENGAPLAPTLPADIASEEVLHERRLENLKSRIYQYDQIFRKWVGQVAKVNKHSAGVANSVRKKLLQDLRSSDDKPPVAVVDEFCVTVCLGWSNDEVEKLRASLVASL